MTLCWPIRANNPPIWREGLTKLAQAPGRLPFRKSKLVTTCSNVAAVTDQLADTYFAPRHLLPMNTNTADTAWPRLLQLPKRGNR
ncbi:hypothetical protein QO002_006264 [Pararhizobium capsulatum DSM 1112]|uniref:Uncharacterized protein n=1 Tax=Pararhizobium capsulatum DSM 1112 TaxID=1121113 RepID=A0ABU0C0K3_9HYPH|nr:hypothetical protein [Pararhizobium capsulatum DSM 1112]